MKYSINKRVMAATAIVAGLLLGGCSSLSKVAADGTTEDPVFPDARKVTFNDKQGTFPNRDSLKEVKAGMTKDQLYHLLGRPHFQEGFFGVREWDYLFHFHTANNGTNGVATCQFKVLFDKYHRAQSFFMRSVGEPNEICTLGDSPKVQQFDLAADGVFAFDKADLKNLTASGKAKLQDLARKIGQLGAVDSIEITGYTDPLGSAAYNRALSAQRAMTVKQYLATLGVPANVMSASGAGATTAFAQCDRRMGKAQLIACLSPNRRVTLKVRGARK
ncbi:cell envelope biogenesis protein OmpA [Advenella sp. S44]|uniref:OmpA family protein n=1 Tax=Advenella sp. S44 TaxID=1982755 RepID=UPI000CB0CF7F|nr:outer membrane protein assembly factor BamE [Advenella sp. S44]PJX23847.1 cell envelope biogenesis protein OmpA [Advenella sp. S44]